MSYEERVPPAPRVLPPPIPPWYVSRPRLIALLQDALRHRVTTVVAGPGFGKSTILAAWAPAVGCAWYTATPGDASVSTLARGLVQALRQRLPVLSEDLGGSVLAGGRGDDPGHGELLAGAISEFLDPLLRTELPLVIDGAEHLGPNGAPGRFLEALVRQAPPSLHLIVSSRTDSPVSSRALDAEPLALGPADLLFTAEETEALVASRVGPIDRGKVQRLHARTGGWPAAVRLMVETLLADPEAAFRNDQDLGRSFSALADEVLGREPPEVLRLLGRVSPFDRVSPELCEALGISDALRILDSLARRGLFVQYEGGSRTWLSLHRLLRDHARERWPMAPEERRATLLQAAAWFAEAGEMGDALRAVEGSGDLTALRSFLIRRGAELVAGGRGEELIVAGQLIPPDDRGPELEMLMGWARRLRGDWDEAFEHYRRAASPGGPLPTPLAWRIAEAHYLRGDLADVVHVASRVDASVAGDFDLAMLRAWEASAHRRLGDRDRAVPLAVTARELAQRSLDFDALAHALTTEMGVLERPEGDPGEEATRRAAEAASERARQPWLRVRFLTNRAQALIHRGRFQEADELTDAAIRLAEGSGDPFNVARVLEVRARGALARGRLAEAVDDASRARAGYERAGSHLAAHASVLLGHAHREEGDLAAARAAYHHSLALAEETANADEVVEALAGLTRLLAHEDPDEAARLAERGLGIHGAQAEIRTQMNLAAGWAALAAGSPDRAATLAHEVSRLATEQRYQPYMAEAAELLTMSGEDPEGLQRALGLWREIRNRVGVARVEFALATLQGRDEGRSGITAALSRLEALGIRLSAAARAGGLLGALPLPPAAPVEIRTLGGFSVVRRGVPVPFSEWKSRKARDLLKILVARRGAPTHREYLMDALWPEEPPDRVAKRLSVATAILRSVLDPEDAFDHQHFVTGEGNSVRVNRDRLAIDVEEFVRRGRAALVDLPRRPGAEEHLPALEAAERLYSGDFLEEDRYEDWATPLREEAKAVYLEVCRALALVAFRAARFDTTVRYGLKALERDPFDETAHLLIVRALAASGRHGEARRRYRVYVSALDDIGVTPSPYPGPPGP